MQAEYGTVFIVYDRRWSMSVGSKFGWKSRMVPLLLVDVVPRERECYGKYLTGVNEGVAPAAVCSILGLTLCEFNEPFSVVEPSGIWRFSVGFFGLASKEVRH